MRLLVTGASGLLGSEVVLAAKARGYTVTAAGRARFDVRDATAVAHAIKDHDVVVNCAAWTAVDDAESREAEAFAVNATAVSYLGRAAEASGARLVHLSTDYVFAGDRGAPYAEDAPLSPRSAYGRTKAAGEWAARASCPDHLVVRTAWLYGAAGLCFPKTIARLARERHRLEVIDDQIGQPTWSRDVAEMVMRLLDADAPSGTYHATSSGSASWCDFARAVVAAQGGDTTAVVGVATEALPRLAPRPAYSVLGHDALVTAGLAPIADWRSRWDVAAGEVLR